MNPHQNTQEHGMDLNELSSKVGNAASKVKKDRHRKLTDQFRYVAGEREAVIRWLKEETIPEIVEKPILVHMHERMKRSGYLSEEYLDLVESRMKRIAEAIGFLASWRLADNSAFYLRVQCASPAEKSFIESNLCRFDNKLFFDLGQDLRRLAVDPYQKSKFLRDHTFSCSTSGLAAPSFVDDVLQLHHMSSPFGAI